MPLTALDYLDIECRAGARGDLVVVGGQLQELGLELMAGMELMAVLELMAGREAAGLHRTHSGGCLSQ